jgi:hypothetical protein
MLRVLLTSVLMALLWLPPGFCFCRYLEAAQPQHESTCCCEPQEEPSESTPGELPDEHEADCACKLREVLASGSASIPTEPIGFAWLHVLADFPSSDANLPSIKQLTHFRSLDRPVPLILCALRI